MKLKTSDFDYNLPQELIAQTPLQQRDASRLLVYHRKEKTVEHRKFHDILEYLHPGDTLVLNNTMVIPARIIGKREETGGKMEFLLLKRMEDDCWEVLVQPGKRAVEGAWFVFGEGKLKAQVLSRTDSGGRIVKFYYDGIWENILDEIGEMPLPPYIHEKLKDRNRYQTVYAKYNGSAAAPTAGLHFTKELLEEIQNKGINIAYILLHVGLGTFRPIKAENIEEHKMHEEYYEITEETAKLLNDTKKNGGRVIAVGTTCTRVLETVASEDGTIHAGHGNTDIFIYPGVKIKAVDGLITNFHLPCSTLIMLVSAFASREEILRVYEIAVKERYRFFSFGDAMALL